MDEGCSCFTGHPPCSYCTSHCTCERCGQVVDNDSVDEEIICEDCLASEGFDVALKMRGMKI